MDLTLTDEDADLLREVVDATLRDLSYEIANTDNAGYKRELRERRDRLQAIQHPLGGVAT